MEDNLELLHINFNSFNGKARLPASKSIANRVLMLQALSDFSFDIDNIVESDDIRVMREALHAKSDVINVGLAGTALRFLSAGFSLLKGKRIITGEKELQKRPIRPLIDALRELGAKIVYVKEEGKIPIQIEGGLIKYDSIQLEQEISSQYVSALMLIGPFLPRGLTIKRIGKKNSESYVLLTRDVMKELGFTVQIENDLIEIPVSRTKLTQFSIESDWSAASYWMSFVTIIPKSKIHLLGLKKESSQSDSEMLQLLNKFGLVYRWENETLELSQNDNVKLPKILEYDFSSMPDQVQTMAFLCAILGVEGKFTGFETLYHKETNRVEALKNELGKIGIILKDEEGILTIKGELKTEKAIISTYADHRMAMAASLLATKMDVEIESPNVVTKSYPRFWEDLKKFTSES